MSCDAEPDPLLAEPLAHAERAREWLEELARIGMHFARQMDAHAAAAMADVCEKKEGNPARAFATLSRAIRLTLAMEARVDAMILALRRGELPRGWATGSAAPPAVERVRQPPRREPLCPAREDLVDRETFGKYEISIFETHVAAFRVEVEPSTDTGKAPVSPPSASFPLNPSSRAEREARRPGTQTDLSGKCALGLGSPLRFAPLRPG